MTVRAEAPAKVNLALRVLRQEASGFHAIRSLAQTVGWTDALEADTHAEDALEVRGAEVPTGTDNLVWKALNLYREAAEKMVRLQITLTKEIPTAAGLGGGSADAAAALRIATELIPGEVNLAELAPRVGADVPFCVKGGTALVSGVGDRVEAVDPQAGYWLGVVVPPFELAAGDVYHAWDQLDGPADEGVSGAAVPPPLRDYTPLVNDLYPAAVSLNPGLDDWRASLQSAWDRPVMMSGSGPSLFGYFADENEAGDAIEAIPPGARAAQAAAPVSQGARITDR
ncbi:MAG: 4-(cytidine 5'-diphospho)-2-C-methyl-D-erythritol kinase [Acidimicrobiia bacterium]